MYKIVVIKYILFIWIKINKHMYYIFIIKKDCDYMYNIMEYIYKKKKVHKKSKFM